jgi:hypothetical protein
MTFIHKLIIGNRFLRYTPFWWWYRLMSHEGYRFDDIQLSKSFWSSLSGGYEDMNYKWAFETFWGKGSYPPEKIILSQRDFDALVDRLNEPPQYNENLAKLLQTKSPWNEQ